MTATFSVARIGRSGTTEIETLRPADVLRLRLPNARSAAAMRRSLERYPERSVWSPETLEYAILAPWRHRPEIAYIDEIDAVRHVEPLLRAAFERCQEQGDELMLVIDFESDRRPSRYERAGLELLEEVVTYELVLSYGAGADETNGPLREERVAFKDAEALAELLRIDGAAFPWLWQNNRTEFETYLATPGVTVSLVTESDVAVGYFGVTHFPGWSHLDRIAMLPSAQGQGFGAQALAFALRSARRSGSRRIGLSTQQTNVRSQRLYERCGFRRTADLDYRLFGSWCRSASAPTRRHPGPGAG